MPARKIGDLLLQSGELRALSRRAQHLAELQRTVLEVIPRPLVGMIRIRSVRSGTLFVAADNSAAAAKLRQLAPRLLEHAQKCDVQVTGIRIEVQVASQQSGPGEASQKRALDSRAVAQFERLARGLTDSPLKHAVTRLLRRNKPSVK